MNTKKTQKADAPASEIAAGTHAPPPAAPEPAPEPVPGLPRSEHFPGIAQRDVDMVKRLADDFAELSRCLSTGKNPSADLVRRLGRAPREVERAKMVARRAARRGA